MILISAKNSRKVIKLGGEFWPKVPLRFKENGKATYKVLI